MTGANPDKSRAAVEEMWGRSLVQHNKLNAAANEVKQAEKKEDPDAVQSIYDDPPSHWFHVIADLSRSLDEYERLYDKPLFEVLALADRKRKREEEILKSGHPMAFMMLGLM